ncbi:hypothetical protein pphageT12_18 [Pseudomonas phage pphageT12]|uniref:Uncharacterized protein n=1 Tax=Pseudomonas phage phiB1_1 TaxID=2755402 RepID=A0A7D7F3V8_9CAUD|nr:hypothetical protein phiB1_1_12 [Pseudomonas phage phiB1_1]UAW53651.1 hypothetical protein pphageB21_18 [Pseudomonas phage pphageB21]UAW53710.1 hypothetical protein pphageT21_18 [Pseudomonas phage pphageT21]UAW53769.1 hypothetical protein pphageT12_18 [Pseudomonas phage pphageT12]UAW53830.1 hypothetical protein pphageBV72_18 [Pseudomonas phage pphageBV72]
MSKVHKALGKLRFKTQQAEARRKDASASARKVVELQGINNILNATVVEQNERMETLAGNCMHYRQRLADVTDKISELEDANGELYSQLRVAQSQIQQADVEYQSNLEQEYKSYRELLARDRATSDAKLKEAQHYLHLSRINTIVVTAALLLTAAWPYVSADIVKLFG